MSFFGFVFCTDFIRHEHSIWYIVVGIDYISTAAEKDDPLAHIISCLSSPIHTVYIVAGNMPIGSAEQQASALNKNLVIAPNDVLFGDIPLSNVIITHPGNLAFSILCQALASKLPLNGDPINVHPIACEMCDEIIRRGGRFVRLRKQSSVPESLFSREETVNRIISIFVTIRAIHRIEVAKQLSVPDVLFALNPPTPKIQVEPSHLNKFPLSYWFKVEWSKGKKRLGVAPPELPTRHTQASLSEASSVPGKPQRGSNQLPPLTKLTSELIEDAIPWDASSIFHVFDRRINFDNHTADASMYALLRAWVQDDPHRKVPPVGVEMSDYDCIIPDATSQVHKESRTFNTSKKVDVFEALTKHAQDVPPIKRIRMEMVNEAKKTRSRHIKRRKGQLQQAHQLLMRRVATLERET